MEIDSLFDVYQCNELEELGDLHIWQLQICIANICIHVDSNLNEIFHDARKKFVKFELGICQFNIISKFHITFALLSVERKTSEHHWQTS